MPRELKEQRILTTGKLLKSKKNFDLTYCQYKPEIVIREKGGVQRELDFWKGKVEPLLDEARDILGDKFQSNAYKFEDLVSDREYFGREY